MDRTHVPSRASGAGTAGAEPAPGRKRLDLLVRMAQEAGDGAVDTIRPRAGGGPAPLSFGQERLWLLHQLDPASTAYGVHGAYRMPRVDAAAMERALGEVVRRHESLRTTFAEVRGAPVQVVAPFAGFTLPVEDLSALGEAEREAAVLRRTGEEAIRPFDLSAGPLFRPRLLRLGDEDVLLLYMHHAVTDAWSFGVLFRELAALYEAYRDGRPSPLAEPALQYADYAAWQRERLRGGELERQLAWWRQRLAGAPPLLELPTDRPRPLSRTFGGASVAATLAPGVLDRLRALAVGEDATLFMVLLGAFQLLLSRYCGTADVVVGSPVEGRSRREVDELIGFFINMLVLRTDLSGDPGFREVLRRVRETTLGAYDHQEMPFEKLVAELQPERSLAHSPLVQVVFAFETEAGGDAAEPAPPGRGIDLETRTAQFDLTLSVFETPRALHVRLGYSTELFERETMERMLGHFTRLLEEVARDPARRLSRVQLVDAGERRLLVDEWNRTARPYPRGACIHPLFEAWVRQSPNAPALVWGGETLAYAELDARANRLARHLRRLDVGPESRVGVLLERGIDLVVSILAILKAGGCYVPLDPAYPPERLRWMLDDSGVRVLLTRGELASPLGDPGIRVVRLDEDAEAIAAGSAEPVESGATALNLAYIVYTSGSTGRPKGVMVAHRHVVQLVRETDYVRLGPGDRVAQASNPSFDALTFEAWGALMNGATLVGLPREVLLSPSALRDALREGGITTLYQTTALLNQLSREHADVFAPLREVLFGGQAVDVESVRRILRAGPPRRLLHMYGPTETTAWCSWEQVEHVGGDAATVSVGRPTGNQRVYLLDGTLNPVPLGVPGEAYVGGDGVVRGYLDRPALTAERFVPDPFSPEPGARMYRTGDRLRWKAVAEARERVSAPDPREDGRTSAPPHPRTAVLEFVGRLDDQVKIRGFRIEPGEVEGALTGVAGVRGARVIVREDEPGEKRLVAYVAGGVDPEAARAHLRRTLPEYMLPAAVVAMESLPLTANGKLDVEALPAPEYAGAEGRYQAPRTPAEEVLAGVWAELLAVERVGVGENFFEAGGHSLLAMRVVSRVREVFGVELPLRTLFERPTVAGLAAAVEELRRDGGRAFPPVAPVGRGGPLPLSFAQERLWFLDRLQPGNALYNLDWPVRLGGALDRGALERALGEIVRRHEALRTTFAEVDGAPVQVIAPFAGFALPVEELSHLAPAEREEALERRARDEAARPFDLARGPLFRAALLRLDEEDHALLLCMHHVVSDGWSMGVFLGELSALYAAFAAGRESPLAPLPVQYADFAVWQRERLEGEVLERQLAYWRGQLAGAPALLELPTDHPRRAVRSDEGDFVPVDLPAELVDGLRALARREGATLFMTLLAVWKVLLAKYAGSDDVVVGSPIAGRTRGEVEGLIGFFVNTLVLRTGLSGDPGFGEVLRRVRQTALAAYEHQDLPFERLVAELQPARSLSHSPLFQVIFALDTAPGGETSLPGLVARGVSTGTQTVKHDLSLGFVADAGGLRGELSYGTALFERATIERMAGHLRRVVEQVATRPGAALSELELLGAAERDRVVHEWNRTGAAYPAGRCIHQLFEEQAERTPHAVAAVREHQSLTYRELNERANRLAHHLRGLGVGPEVRVGVCLERGLELPVSLLAVLKAGGAYVPLDPAYPPERLEITLGDAGAPVLVTQEKLRALLPSHGGVEVVVLERAAPALAAAPAHNPASGVAPRNLAYLIYTSGSTGRPKGVAIEHESAVAMLAWSWSVYSDEDFAGMLASTSVCFDMSVFELFAPLARGGRVILVDNALALPGSAAAGQVRLLDTVPSAAAALLGTGGIPAGVKTVNLGGEPLRPELVDALYARGVERVYDLYGPSEDTTFSTFALRRPGAPPSIGRILSNSRAYVLDAALRPVPVGVPGELYLGGKGVTRGYLGRPGATAGRYLPDPLGGVPGARMYRTGDRVRWRADGTLEYLGRLDAQVKVRGFRVEPGEVEAALRGHPQVADCAVAARHDAAGETRLVAYLVGAAEVEALRAHLRRSLPEYMLPSAFVTLPALPLTPSGKVDRLALPAPTPARAGRRLEPGTGLEARIAGLWREVLGVEEVGADDNFFELGGHSLLLVRLQARLAAELGQRMEVVELFQHPTVRALAARLRGAGEGGAVAEGEERADARHAARGRLEARRRRE